MRTQGEIEAAISGAWQKSLGGLSCCGHWGLPIKLPLAATLQTAEGRNGLSVAAIPTLAGMF